MALEDTLLAEAGMDDSTGELVQPRRSLNRSRPRTFELSDDAEMQLKEMARSARPAQSSPVSQPKPGKPLGLMGTIKEGAKGTLRMLGATADTMQGDAQGVVQAAQDQATAPKDPDLKRFYEHIEEQKKALGENPSLWEGIKAVGSAALETPRGFGLMVAEQLPNSGAALGMAGAGALAGSFGGPVGMAVGGLAGLATANIGLETGAKALEAAQDQNFSPEEQSRVRREGLTKGSVITGVDAVTIGLTKFITNASRRAVEAATIKTLTDNGVDVTSAAARKTAMETPEIAEAVKAAQETARQGAETLGKRIARTGGAVALETIGEGAGEFLGELAATGKANAIDAVIEGFAGMGTSIGQITAIAAMNRKALNRLLDTQEEAQKKAQKETRETGVEHEVIPHPTEPDKFAAVPKVRSVAGIELERDAQGNLRPTQPTSTQSDFNLANRPGFELTAEDRLRQREIEKQKEEAYAKNPIVIADKIPTIAGKPASELPDSALEYTINRGSERARQVAKDEIERRQREGIAANIARNIETPSDTAKRIITTGAERAQEDGKKVGGIVTTTKQEKTATASVKPIAIPKTQPTQTTSAKDQTTAPKEDWQKTRKEFGVPDEPVDTEVPRFPKLEKIARETPERLSDGDKALLAKQKAAKAKHAKFLKDHKKYLPIANAHFLAVKNAVEAGKPVPDEVLNEYPHLRKGEQRTQKPVPTNSVEFDRIKTQASPTPETNAGAPSSQKTVDLGPTDSLRPHIESLIKRRAAASQTGKERTVNNAISRAKEIMDGKRTDSALESKWFRTQAAAMRKSDPETAEILGRIGESIEAKPSANSEVVPKSNAKAQENQNNAGTKDSIKKETASEKTEEKAKPAVAVRGDTKPVPRGGRILANGIAEEIQRNGVAALVGQKITSPERLAELAQVYRNPKYETFRIFFTRGNEIVHASGVTARLPGKTPIFPENMNTAQGAAWIKGMMESSGADGYWMLHNHPSGNPTPSEADVQATKHIASLVPGMKGHVIINSNQYAHIRLMRKGAQSQVFTKDFGKDTLLQASRPHEYLGRKVPDPSTLVSLGKSFQKEGWVTLIGVSGTSGVRAIAEIPLKTFITPALARGAIRRFSRRTGSDSIFAYGTSADLDAGKADDLVREGFLRDAVDEHGTPRIARDRGKTFGLEPGKGGVEVRQDEVKAQTDSPAFKKWFGNSKVVDESGKPLVVYKAMYPYDWTQETASNPGPLIESINRTTPFPAFNGDEEGVKIAGFFGDKSTANRFAELSKSSAIYPVYLSFRHPKIIDAQGAKAGTIQFGENGREFRDAIRSGQYDSVIIKNTSDEGDVYVALKPEQIKSAIGNRGTFDDSPVILNQTSAPYSRAALRDRVEKITDSLIYNFQDRFKPLKDIQKRAGPVAEDEDAALAEERYSGIVRSRLDNFEDQLRDPLLKAIHDSGVAYEDVEKYLHALHAPSRNAAMKEINPTEGELKTQISTLENQRDTLAKDADVKRFIELRRELRQAEADIEDGIADESLARGLKSDIAQIRQNQSVKDYAEALDKLKGLRLVKPFKGDNAALSGMSDKEAADILAKADKDGTRAKLDKVSALVDSITQSTRQIYVDSGLEKADAINAWNQKYQHYVPLHRDEVGGNTMPKVGQGFNIRGKESKRATGSTKEVVDILAHVVAQHEAAIIRSEKARVDRALFQFASTHPDPSLWTLDNAPMLRTVDPVTGFVVERVDPTYKNRPEVLTLKIDGEEHTITFDTQNPEAMRLAASMKNLSSQEMGEVTQMVGRFTRFLATMNTTANPVFTARNFMRDLQTAYVNLSDTAIADKKREVFRDVPSAIKGMWAMARGKKNSQWAKYAQEFKAAGGQTGWMDHYKDIGSRADALRKELEVMKPGRLNAARRTWKSWVDIVNDANNAVENGARLAAFVNARRSGLSEAKAAQLAKNLTVNFNAKGAKSVELNAWYMFMNASIQGTARLIKAMSNRQVRKIVAGIVLSGFLMDVLARAMAGDDDEDGENDYDQLPEHTKAMNFVLMVGGQPVTVPMPYGYNFFASAGRKVSEMIFRENYSPVKSATDLASIFLDAFSPVGQAGSGLQFVAPTVADPFVQWAENKNFAGNPLRKDQSTFGVPKPEYQMGFKSTSAPGKWLAEALNNATGGNEVRPGFVNVNPTFFDFVVSSIAGGAGRTYLQTFSGPVKALGDDEVKAREVPFLNIFVGARPEYQTERKYFEAVGEVELAQKELTTYREKGDVEMVRQIREEHRAALRMSEAAKITKELLTRLRKRDLALDKADPENKRELRRELEEKKREAMSRFNRKYKEAIDAEG